LPSRETEAAIEVEKSACDEAHDGSAEGKSDVEAADGSSAQVGRKPLHEVEEHSGEVACLGRTKEEADGVELPGRADEEHPDG
jgi:hypothetical protein